MQYPQDVKEAVVRSALAGELTQDAIGIGKGRNNAAETQGGDHDYRDKIPPLCALGVYIHAFHFLTLFRIAGRLAAAHLPAAHEAALGKGAGYQSVAGCARPASPGSRAAARVLNR
jgi:hypothetical protein